MGPRTENYIRTTMQGILTLSSSSSSYDGGLVTASYSEPLKEKIRAFAVEEAVERFCSNSVNKEKWLAKAEEWTISSIVDAKRDLIINALTTAPPAPIDGVSGGARGGGSGFFGAIFETRPDNGTIVKKTMRTFNASFEEDDLEIVVSNVATDFQNLRNRQDIGKVHICTNKRLTGVVKESEQDTQYLSISILNISGRRLKCLIRHCVCESSLDTNSVEKRLTNGRLGSLSIFEIEGDHDVNYKNNGSFIGIGEEVTFTVCSGINSNNNMAYAVMCLFSM